MVPWRHMQIALLLVLAAQLSGCVDDDNGPPRDPNAADPADAPAARAEACPDPPPTHAVVPGCPLAPRSLADGTRFTYTASGVWDMAPTLEVVVVRQDGGYLFAGGSKEQLYDAAIWWRHQYGPHDNDLNLLRDDGAPRPLFDWPLYDNKTWKYGDVEVTAHEEDVPAPGGTERGFRMSRSDDDTTYTWTYAPSVGYLTTYTYADADWTYESIRLDKVDTAAAWVWFERGPYFSAGTHQGTVPLAHASTWDVPPEHDDIVFIGLGTEGTRAAVHGPNPGGTPWTFEGGPMWTWGVNAIPATPGAWSFAFTRTDTAAFIGVEAVAVTWTGP